MKKIIIIVIMFLSVITRSAVLHAEGEVKFVQLAFSQIFQIDRDRGVTKSDYSIIFSKIFNIDELLKRASQDFNQKITPEQYGQLKEVFSKLLIQNITTKAGRISGKKFMNKKYLIEKVSDSESIVRVKGRTERGEVSMDFVMVPFKTGWMIADISLEGALLSRNYRGQFNRIFRVEGFEGLYTRIKTKASYTLSS